MTDWADEIAATLECHMPENGEAIGCDPVTIAVALRKAKADGLRSASSYCHARANYWCDHGDYWGEHGGDGKLVGEFEAACIELAARAGKAEKGET